MPGVKGRSGRRSLTDEAKRQAIIDKAWDIAREYLNDLNVPLKDKMEVAAKIIVKDMPEKLTDGDGDPLPIPIVNVYVTKHTADRRIYTEESSGSIGASEQAV